MGVIDLNSPKTSRMPEFERLSEVNHAYRKDCLLPSDRISSHAYVSPLSAAIRWKPQDQIVQLPRSIPLHGFCSVDLQRKSPGYRSLSSVPNERSSTTWGVVVASHAIPSPMPTSWLPGFWKAFQYGSGRSIFRHPSQVQYCVPTPLLTSHKFCRSIQRSKMRSGHRTDWRQRKGRLPSVATTDQIPRQQHRQDLQLPDQQLHCPCTDSSRSVSLPVAGRALLQVDQTAPENQSFLRNLRECSEESDLDCHLGLRARSHHQKAAQARNRALHNSTDFEPYPFRENPFGSTAYDL